MYENENWDMDCFVFHYDEWCETIRAWIRLPFEILLYFPILLLLCIFSVYNYLNPVKVNQTDLEKFWGVHKE